MADIRKPIMGKPAREDADTGKADARCAVCGRPVLAQFHPFCSRRCADIDLGRWLTGEYRIPGPAQEDLENDDDAEDV